ncbi:AMP-binding protein [Pseudorhodoferax sp. Leaf274]|uniref:AMP-binding protein n=1 Tax=Pseudorhodoferax sp. Leaf274 TaxID=1736318 RepID=UPI000A4CFF34|nr:AMP-binding protein [Pseudorhodoferax sp. Leaf274]
MRWRVTGIIATDLLSSLTQRNFSFETDNESHRTSPTSTAISPSRQYKKENTRFQLDQVFWQKNLSNPPARPRFPVSSATANPSTKIGLSVWSTRIELKNSNKSSNSDERRIDIPTLATVLCHTLRDIIGETDFLIGIPVSNRNRKSDMQSVGHFAEVKVLRIKLAPKARARETLESVRLNLFNLLRHRDYDINDLKNCTSSDNVESFLPLPSILLNFQSLDEKGFSLSSHRLGYRHIGIDSKTALELNVLKNGSYLSLEFHHDSKLIGVDLVKRICEVFTTILCEPLEVERTPSLYKSDLAIEEIATLTEWNNTQTLYPFVSGLHTLFEEQTARSPERIALRFESRDLSYGELNRCANIMALKLRLLGVRSGSLIAVYMSRGPQMVVTLLGILKAGSAYLPLDTETPEERLLYMVEDSRPSLILTDSYQISRLPAPARRSSLCVEDGWFAEHSAENPEPATKASDLAYVIYTSGSSGRPKGVEVQHSAIINRIQWMQDEYGLDTGDVVLHKTPISFDVSVWEIFWPLSYGGILLVAKPDGHRDPRYLAELIASNKTSFLHFVPSMLLAFLNTSEGQALSTVKKVFSSGEELSWGIQAFGRSASIELQFGEEKQVVLSNADCMISANFGVVRQPDNEYSAQSLSVPCLCKTSSEALILSPSSPNDAKELLGF